MHGVTMKFSWNHVIYFIVDPGGRTVYGEGQQAARMLGLWFRIPPGA